MKELAWCDAVPMFLLIGILSILTLFEPSSTINNGAWWAASWWPLLRLGLIVWGIARFIDLILRGPVRRSNKRHLAAFYQSQNRG